MAGHGNGFGGSYKVRNMVSQAHYLEILKHLPSFYEIRRAFRFVFESVVFLGVLMVVAALAYVGLQILFSVWQIGIRLGKIDEELVISLWVAEVPIAVFLRYIFGEGRHRPRLTTERIPTFSRNGARYATIVIRNQSDTGAESCDARISLKVTANDVLDIPNTDSVITKAHFAPIVDFPICCWSKKNSADIPIKAQDGQRLEIARLIPREGDIPLHIEIPSEAKWTPILVALKPKDYQATIKIVSMNSRVMVANFRIETSPDGQIFDTTFPPLPL